MDLNIVAFAYLFLRLAPFVLVCFFSLSSLFNQDFKGLVYLVGLLVSCFLSMISGSMFEMFDSTILNKPENRVDEMCNILTINGAEISKLPLGQNIFGYTFAYLLFGMITNSTFPDDQKNRQWYEKTFSNSLVNQNIPTIVFFCLLIAFDFLWNINNTCYHWHQLLISLVLGGAFGLLWAIIIDSTKTDSLKYFSGLNNNEVCSRPSKQTFKCKVYKGGEVIAEN
jgi:hypothetical protein